MKYMGSKSRIAKSIVPIIQSYVDKGCTAYIEPFCGGMNVIDKISHPVRMASDSNKYLIALFQHLVAGGSLPESVPFELYDAVRSSRSDYDDWLVGAVGFLSSYNGRFFDGGYARSGYEQTKNGSRFRDYYQESNRNILAQISMLVGVEMQCKDFTEINPSGAVIYCDPPYAGVKQYANALTFDYELFWQTVREWSRNNVVLVSEEHAPDDFLVLWSQSVSRSIKPTDKSDSVEKLFTLPNAYSKGAHQ